MRVCAVIGCDNPHQARDLCNLHYRRWLRAMHLAHVPLFPNRDSLVPPVCVCDHPHVDGIGECTQCRRPWKREFAVVRMAWRECYARNGWTTEVAVVRGA